MDCYDTIDKRLVEHYKDAQEQLDKTFGIFLHGSQNYGLDTPDSDVDTIALALPTFDDMISGKPPISTTYVRANNEHITLTDIRKFFKQLRKGDPCITEILFTNYASVRLVFVDMWNELVEMREEIGRYSVGSTVNCLVGNMKSRHERIVKRTTIDQSKLEKFGYDPKALYHFLRLNEFLQRYLAGEPYADCLISKQRDYLKEAKAGAVNYEDAVKISAEIMGKVPPFMEIDINQDTGAKMHKIMREILATSMDEDIIYGYS